MPFKLQQTQIDINTILFNVIMQKSNRTKNNTRLRIATKKLNKFSLQNFALNATINHHNTFLIIDS